MSTFTRLTHTFKSADEICFDNTSKFIFFSDCHRGDKSKIDDFARNSAIYRAALDYYYAHGYTYIEIGDGDELWENDRFSTLLNAHKEVYLLIQKFHREGRFYMIWGNHDIFKKSSRFVQRRLFKYYNPQTHKFEPLFDGIKVRNGLILRYSGTPHRLFIVHGHQGDTLNDYFWPLSRFIVRYVWRHIEYLRHRNPLSPARSALRMNAVERNLIRWIKINNQLVIAGHTHHPAFPMPGEILYFNSGCCIYPDHITGIEIKDDEIMLVKWSQKSRGNNPPVLTRDIIAGPEKIQSFFHIDTPE